MLHLDNGLTFMPVKCTGVIFFNFLYIFQLQSTGYTHLNDNYNDMRTGWWLVAKLQEFCNMKTM